VISAEVRLHALDPVEFGRLCGLLAARDLADAGELQVLHSGGRVVHAVHTGGHPVRELPAVVTDPPATARALRESCGVARVVLVEESALRAVAAQSAAARRPEQSQAELFWAARKLFYDSPGVVCDPAPEPDSWVRFAAHVRGLGDGWSVLAAYDGESCVLALAGRWQGGLLVEVTTPPGPRPARAQAAEMLDAAAGVDGPVALGLIGDLALLDALAAAPDLPAAVLAAAAHPDTLASRGLP